MSSEHPVSSRPAPAKERGSEVSDDREVHAAEAGRVGRSARQPSYYPRGAGATGHSDNTAIEQRQQEAGGTEDEMSTRQTRQRTRGQQQHLVGEPQSERRRETRRTSAMARLQDEQYKEQQEAERKRKQRKDIKEHIQSICDQIEDPYLIIEEIEALRSPPKNSTR
jgi:hypothetical protein